MSITVSAWIEHPWRDLSRWPAESLAASLKPKNLPPGWDSPSNSVSAGRRFARGGSTSFFFDSGFHLTLGQAMLELMYYERWSCFLMYKGVRRKFLSACSRIAQLSCASEILILPEGTDISYVKYDPGKLDKSTFTQMKRIARTKWGPPDLDIRRYYTMKEIDALGWDRIHYFVVKTANAKQKLASLL